MLMHGAGVTTPWQDDLTDRLALRCSETGKEDEVTGEQQAWRRGLLSEVASEGKGNSDLRQEESD